MFPSSHPPNNTQGPILLLPFHHLLFLSFHLTTFKISSQSDGDNLGPLWLTTVKGVEGMHGTSLGQCDLHSQGHRECHASSSRTPPHVALASETQVKGPIFALWQGWPTFRRPSQRCAVLASPGGARGSTPPWGDKSHSMNMVRTAAGLHGRSREPLSQRTLTPWCLHLHLRTWLHFLYTLPLRSTGFPLREATEVDCIMSPRQRARMFWSCEPNSWLRGKFLTMCTSF